MEIDRKYIDSQIIKTSTGFVVDVDKLKAEQISILKAVYKAGDKHMKYYYSTMNAFKHPELRVKTFDTQYYEQAMPEIAKILQEYDKRKSQD